MKVGHCENKTNKFTNAAENIKDLWTVKTSIRVHKHGKTLDATEHIAKKHKDAPQESTTVRRTYDTRRSIQIHKKKRIKKVKKNIALSPDLGMD